MSYNSESVRRPQHGHGNNTTRSPNTSTLLPVSSSYASDRYPLVTPPYTSISPTNRLFSIASTSDSSPWPSRNILFSSSSPKAQRALAINSTTSILDTFSRIFSPLTILREISLPMFESIVVDSSFFRKIFPEWPITGARRGERFGSRALIILSLKKARKGQLIRTVRFTP